MAEKAPHPTDRHVGARVRTRRLMLGMSQEGLGNRLGLTFQQVQKYEKGANRISASRLQEVARILQVPVSFFFEGVPSHEMARGALPSLDYVIEFLASKDGLDLCNAFTRIKDRRLRRALVDLVSAIASEIGSNDC